MRTLIDFILVAGLLVTALLQPAIARADDYSFDAGIPKQGTEDLTLCIGRGSAGGDTYTTRQWFGVDYARLANPATHDAEARWSEGYGRRSTVEAVQGWFRYQRGIELPAEAVRVDCSRP